MIEYQRTIHHKTIHVPCAIADAVKLAAMQSVCLRTAIAFVRASCENDWNYEDAKALVHCIVNDEQYATYSVDDERRMMVIYPANGD